MSETAIYRHKKRGTLYALLGIGKMQAEEWHEWTANYSPKDDVSKVLGVSVDMREVAVYRSLDDGQIWVRPREEFEDGRFELATNLRHSPTPPPQHRKDEEDGRDNHFQNGSSSTQRAD